MHQVLDGDESGRVSALAGCFLEWVTAPDRTFDLTDADVADLVEAGVSEDVINAMLARSDEHHEEKGQADEHEH